MQLVYAGRLVQYQKRVLDYIELASALDRTGVSYEISLIGEFVSKEGIQPVFEQRGRAHLDDGRIRLLGRLPRKRILEQLTRTTFFPLLSDFEGLPLSLVEAMAAGCVPIVAEMPSGIPELVTSGHDGVIMSGRDYDAWAALLVELWEDGARLTAMSRNARKTVREAFTIEKIGGESTGSCAGSPTTSPPVATGARTRCTGDGGGRPRATSCRRRTSSIRPPSPSTRG